MFEKVSPLHPDKIADRIAGAIVDAAYKRSNNPKIAVEVLIGHGECVVIAESSEILTEYEVNEIVRRIAGNVKVRFKLAPQDVHLAQNQDGKIRCGDNGIFKGVPITNEQKRLSNFAKALYKECPYDGKFILTDDKMTICQSNDDGIEYGHLIREYIDADEKIEVVVNPLGKWTGGIEVDSGATNRKLGSDMGDSVTGGGLSGKDLSKADVSVNIYAWLKAQETGESVELTCSIGDEEVDGRPYSEIVEIARNYIDSIGGFEKFSEWGLV